MPDARHGWFSGLLLPVTTPFDPVTGEVAPVLFRDNLRRWLASPIDGVVLFGSTGEGALLDEEEKRRMIGFARDLLPAHLPLIAGVHAESTRGAIRLARAMADAGADAVLVSPPTYFGAVLSAGALRDHFTAIADDSPVPVVLYHVPKFTHVVLEAGLVGELSRHGNIAAIKDSSGDLKRLADYTNVCANGCGVLVGSGALLYTALELGAVGGIVALGLLATDECAAIVHHFHAGEPQKAGAIQTRIAPVHRDVVARFGVPGVKAALDLLGFAGGRPRPPLGALSGKERAHVAHVLQAARLA